MAYLEPAIVFAGAQTAIAAGGARSASTSLSPLEWSVVSIARGDGLASLSEPSRLRRVLASVFGARRSATLADPRLEALRRFAVHAWHRGYALPVSEIKAFLAEGFTMDQAEAALASIAGARTGRR